MDDRGYIDDRTRKLVEEARRHMMGRRIPAIDVDQPTFDPKVRDQLNKQAEDILGTATGANAQLQEAMGSKISASAKAAIEDLIAGPDLTRLFKTDLDLTFGSTTITDYLAGTNTTSTFAFQRPTLAEQLGVQVDTKALMGLTGIAETAGKIAEQWRLAGTGALSSFGESFDSLRAALDFEQSLKSSTLAQAVLLESWKLDDDQAHRLAEADLTETANTGVEAELEADQGLATVVGAIQRYFIVYLGYSPEQAHNLVRRIIWLLLFSLSLYTHSQVESHLNRTVEFGLGVVAMSAICTASTRGAATLISDGKRDTTD